MAKRLLNEAERYVFEHWEEALAFEESMDKVRKKCAGLLDRVVEAVQEAHPELDSL